MRDEPEAILVNELIFKQRLGVGEDCYKFLKSARNLEHILGTAGAASGGTMIASSFVVATTFFPSSGLLAWIGLGAAAATPIGWVLAAGVLAGGAYYGIRRKLDKVRDDVLVQFPKYVNTPLHLLADKLMGLMLPLSIWIARSDDGEVSGEEKEGIVSYYVEEWGYAADFVEFAIEQCVGDASDKIAGELAKSLSDYCAANRDCNKNRITEFLVDHLHEFVETEGNGVSRERKARALRELETEFARRTGWWSR